MCEYVLVEIYKDLRKFYKCDDFTALKSGNDKLPYETRDLTVVIKNRF